MGNGSGTGKGKGGGGAASVSKASGSGVADGITEHGVAGMGRLSELEKSVINDYGFEGYETVNDFLRDKADFLKHRDIEQPSLLRTMQEKSAKKRIGLISSAIKKGTLTKTQTFYRGTNLNDFGRTIPKVGDVYRQDGFLSTSTSRRVGKKFAEWAGGQKMLIKVQAPKGARAVDVSHVAGGSEHEVLFNKGSRLKVTNVRVGKNGHVVVKAKLIK